MERARIAGLFRYPVKSCRGLSEAIVNVTERGWLHDRAFMIVDQNDRFLTQREQPALATIAISLQPSGVTLSCDATRNGVALTPRPYLASFDNNGRTRRQVRVWNDMVEGFDCGDEAADWLRAILGVSVRLVHFPFDQTRPCSTSYTQGFPAHTAFADGYPILVANQTSLDDLNRRMNRPLPMDRFRANLVLDGLAPWDEDHIDTLTIGAVTIKLVKPCIRCITSTTDQLTGARFGEEPLATLARFRNNPDLGGVTFAWNAIVVGGAGETVNLNDVATVKFRFE